MAVTKEEYNLWRETNPRFAILHKLHAEDVNQQFGGIPRAIKMSWEDYDKYIHLNDLCAYDLLLQVLGMGVKMGQLPFMLDRTRDWTIAIGNKTAEVHGELDSDGYYLLQLSKPTKRVR